MKSTTNFTYFLVLIHVLFISIPLYSNATPDSLLVKYQNSSNDSVKTYALREIINYYKTNNFDSSIYYGKKIILQAAKSNNDKFIYKGYYWVVNGYSALAAYDSALRYAFQGLKYFETKEDQYPHIVILTMLGEQYRAMAMYDNALTYFEKSWHYTYKHDFPKLRPSISNRLAATFYENKQSDEAIAWADSSIKMCEQTERYNNYLSNFNIKGAILRDQKKFNEALDVFHAALSFAEDRYSKNSLVLIWNNLASTYSALNNPERTIFFATKAYDYTSENNMKSVSMISAELLAKTYAQIGNYKKAYNYGKRYEQIKNDVFFEERDEQIAELHTKYETEQKEKLIEIQNINLEKKDLRIQRNKLISGFFILLIALLIVFLIMRYRSGLKLRKVNKELSKQNIIITDQKIKINNAYQELQKLDDFKQSTTKMLVHDLKNPLNLLSHIDMFDNEEEKRSLIKHSIKQMLNLVMNMLDVSKSEHQTMELNLKPEGLKSILEASASDVEYLAKTKSVRLNFSGLSDYIIVTDYNILTRVFTNLLTNAIKFSPSGSEVTIYSEISENRTLCIYVKDDGTGVEEKYQKQIFEQYNQIRAVKSGYLGSTGLGLAYCKAAIESHQWEIGVNSEFGHGAAFWIEIDKFDVVESKPNTMDVPTEGKNLLELKLSKYDFELLKPHLDHLRLTSIFAISDIKAEIENIRMLKLDKLEPWLKELWSATENMEVDRYNQLINTVSK